MNHQSPRLGRTYLEETATWRPDEVAIRSLDTEEAVSYDDLDRAANRFANAVHDEGLRAGDRLAIALPNVVAFPVALFGCHKRGVVPVVANHRFATEEFAHVLDEARPEAIVCSADVVETVREAATTAGWTGEPVVVGGSAGGRSFESLVDAGDDGRPPPLARASEDVSYMFYSTGTTGDPTAVVHTPRSCRNRVLAGIESTGIRPETVCLGLLPFFHGGGLDTVLRTSLAVGATLLITTDRHDPRRLLDAIETHGVTDVRSVPTLTQRFLNVPDLGQRDLSSIEAWRNGGTVLTESVAREFAAELTPNVYNAYGTSESGTNAVLRPSDLPEHAGTVGKPLVDTEVRVVEFAPDRDVAPDETVPRGESGEVLLRSPQLFRGYFERETETRERVRDGWYYTHDLGHVDDEGYLVVEGRTDDVVVSGGELVSAVEVEEVLAEHEAVADVVVGPTDDEEWGDVVTAYVVATDGYDEDGLAETLDEHCLSHSGIADYKRPRRYEFVTSVEYNELGKKLRSDVG